MSHLSSPRRSLLVALLCALVGALSGQAVAAAQEGPDVIVDPPIGGQPDTEVEPEPDVIVDRPDIGQPGAEDTQSGGGAGDSGTQVSDAGDEPQRRPRGAVSSASVREVTLARTGFPVGALVTLAVATLLSGVLLFRLRRGSSG